MKILQYIIIGAVCVYSIKLFGQPACSETINTTTTDWREPWLFEQSTDLSPKNRSNIN